MKLLTKEIKSKLPKLASTDGLGGRAKIIVKFFDPQGAATWWVTEGEEQEDGDWLFFGYADLYGTGRNGGAELGYMSLNEMAEYKGKLGLGIERDRHFGYDTTLGEVM